MQKLLRRKNERGVILLVSIASLVMLIPMVGLTVDVGYLYASKTRLQAAVDEASLAAARALVLGATTTAQADTAKQNAVNWFYSNFPVGNWSTTDTTMNTGTVTVTEPPSQPNLRIVSVTASTRVPTYFMKWFHISNTPISAIGTANRRDVVVMLVLDRSSSMNTTSSCDDLRAAAKLFNGQFAAGRDRIGLASFSDGVYVSSAPTTSFRTVLGFDTGTTSGTGAIDNIVCNGGTGTAGAVTVAYNELYKINLPGALNVLLIETDGLPNTLALNFWDSTNATNYSGLSASSACKDRSGKARNGSPAGWGTATSYAYWTGDLAYGGFLCTIGGGMIGSLYSGDPTTVTQTTAPATQFEALSNPLHTSLTEGIVSSPLSWLNTTGGTAIGTPGTPGCAFNSTHTTITDFTRIPRVDVFGNDTYSSDPYYPPNSASGVHFVQTNGTTAGTTSANSKYVEFNNSSGRWLDYHRAAANATDNAAYRARAGYSGNIPATVYMIGLGGNGATDYTLMQRMANDSGADIFNTPALYSAATLPTSFNTQPKGKLVFSSDYSDLRRAFLSLSSQILRLSQ